MLERVGCRPALILDHIGKVEHHQLAPLGAYLHAAVRVLTQPGGALGDSPDDGVGACGRSLGSYATHCPASSDLRR
jgi:hypothetical protein